MYIDKDSRGMYCIQDMTEDDFLDLFAALDSSDVALYNPRLVLLINEKNHIINNVGVLRKESR